jgi:hypothetical protein
MPGASTLMVMLPRNNAAVVILSNASTRPVVAMQEFAIAREALAAAVAPATPPRVGPPPGPPPSPPAFVVSPDLAGDWSGTLWTYEQPVPIRLQINSNGRIQISIANQPSATVTNPSYVNGRLLGQVATTIPTDDTQRWPHDVSFALLFRTDGTLGGQVTANSTGDRVYFSLSSYAELRKDH